MIDLERIRAVLFDLDGVLTPTADVHQRAWAELFSEYFSEHAIEPPYSEIDYFARVDGRPRYDAVAAMLESRGVTLPHGDPADPPTAATVCGLGNRKNEWFRSVLAADGVAPYLGAVRFLDWVTARGLAVAVVSSSRNARLVLDAAGLISRFPVIVDGNVAAERGLAGKPAPDTYLAGARELGVEPQHAAVVEDAISGVAAGAAGHFGAVIGVDRGAGSAELLAAGASEVVAELDELIPQHDHPEGKRAQQA